MNPAEDVDDILDTAENILAIINEVYAEAGVDLPARQFFYAGATYPHECEQVSVGFLQHYSGSPGDQAQEPTRCQNPRTAVYAVEVVRNCAPTLEAAQSPSTGRRQGNARNFPSPEALTADARIKMRDARLLLEAGLRAGELGIATGAMADVSAGEVNGTYQGMVLNVIIEVS